MQRTRFACLLVLMAGALACRHTPLRTRTETYYACRACLADDPHRCANASQDCGDLPSQSDAQLSAHYALCKTLPKAIIAKRPTPQSYKPTPWFPNACDEWPASDFRYTCTTFKKECGDVPIH